MKSKTAKYIIEYRDEEGVRYIEKHFSLRDIGEKFNLSSSCMNKIIRDKLNMDVKKGRKLTKETLVKTDLKIYRIVDGHIAK